MQGVDVKDIHTHNHASMTDADLCHFMFVITVSQTNLFFFSANMATSPGLPIPSYIPHIHQSADDPVNVHTACLKG